MSDAPGNPGDWLDSLPQPPASLIDEIVASLDISEDKIRQALCRQLPAHARNYAAHIYLTARFPTPHQVRTKMGELSTQVRGARETLRKLPLEHAVLLPVAFHENANEGVPEWQAFLAGLDRFGELADRLSHVQLANKQPNRKLKYTVGGLMLLLEQATGNRARVRRRSDDREPELVSAEAKAIGSLLRSVNPELQITTLVNVIESIRREYRNRPLHDYEWALLIGSPVRVF